MTWLLEQLRAWWSGPVYLPLESPDSESSEPAPVARLVTPPAPAFTTEQLAHHARRKRRQNAHVATQAVVSGGN